MTKTTKDPAPATVHKFGDPIAPCPEEAHIRAELIALEVELDRDKTGTLGMGIAVKGGRLVARPVRQFDATTGKVNGYAVGIFDEGHGLLGILGSFASLSSWPVQLAMTGVSRAVR